MGMERLERIEPYEGAHHRPDHAERNRKFRVGGDPEPYIYVPETRTFQLGLHLVGVEAARAGVMPFGQLRIPCPESRAVGVPHAVVDMVKASEEVVRVVVDVDNAPGPEDAIGSPERGRGIQKVVDQGVHRNYVELLVAEGEPEGLGRRQVERRPPVEFPEKVRAEIHPHALPEVCPGQPEDVSPLGMNIFQS